MHIFISPITLSSYAWLSLKDYQQYFEGLPVVVSASYARLQVWRDDEELQRLLHRGLLFEFRDPIPHPKEVSQEYI